MSSETPEPFKGDEIEALRHWHRRRFPHSTKCAQGDYWPCRTARFLATLDAQSNPALTAAFYIEWNDRLEKEALAARLRESPLKGA